MEVVAVVMMELAIDLIHKLQPDLVVLDIIMPQMDGIEH